MSFHLCVILNLNGFGTLVIDTTQSSYPGGPLAPASKVNWCRRQEAKRKNSCLARDLPRHSLLPTPKATIAGLGLNLPVSGSMKRSGLNSSGESKWTESRRISELKEDQLMFCQPSKNPIFSQ